MLILNLSDYSYSIKFIFEVFHDKKAGDETKEDMGRGVKFRSVLYMSPWSFPFLLSGRFISGVLGLNGCSWPSESCIFFPFSRAIY